MNVSVIFVLRESKNGELPVPVLSVAIVLQMAGNKFQLCSSHVTLKMTHKYGLAVFLLINQSAAESKTRSIQTIESITISDSWEVKASQMDEDV